ncbi:uncharacterized protein LOC106462958 [Limulus polyphemus]|uniref:Uncharacterized protein LOC106462958 n=1 Tax=Limulus polyphemus TaxID=6850 RepID=A0ABM1SR08_LIMPO|nr:uncharacterized protein LOC106462958 [Limulus polyphemus]XP_022246064.1 uncharacterized protein LOC106462958 [Limulus polyphemus]XP_022246066.1 uncharacterized protein LOC106462958 [Limulus polyphemus]XP_022246067.1 uncharacterized protein LOC106462958 [Limulus polyphemus]
MMPMKHPCVALLAVIFVSISSCSATQSSDSITHFTQRQPLPMKRGSQISIISASKTRDETKECHKYALHKCGNIFLRVLKLLHFLRDHHSYQVKCSLRQAFFTCIQKLRKKPCWHHKHHINYNLRVFRKKLADSLWSTRSCVLLVTSEINQ